MCDATVEAFGELSAALETVEHARAHLYAFHRFSGTADLGLQQAVRQLREGGHAELADEISDVLVSRNVIAGRRTFHLLEDYDVVYWTVFRTAEERARQRLGDAEPHIHEAEMKNTEQR